MVPRLPAGYDRMTKIPRAQDQLFDTRQSAREKYAALVVGRSGLGRAHQARDDRVVVAARARRARLRAAQDVVSQAAGSLRPQRDLRPERRAPSPAQDPHRRQRRRSTTTACSMPKARRTAASRSAAGSSSAATRSCRARTATSTSRTAPTSGSTASCFRRAACGSASDTLLAAYCYLIGGDHDFSDLRSRCWTQARTSDGRHDRRGRVARRRRENARRRHDRRWRHHRRRRRRARSSVPAGAIAVGIPAEIVGQRSEVAHRDTTPWMTRAAS